MTEILGSTAGIMALVAVVAMCVACSCALIASVFSKKETDATGRFDILVLQ